MDDAFELDDLPRWMAGGACVEVSDPDIFYPERGQSAGPAKRICSQCPVKGKCLAWALEHEDYGVWGGLSSRERKQLRQGAA